MSIVKRIKEGEMLPPWYGFAWRDYAANQAITLPVGLNFIAWVIRACYWALKTGPSWVHWNPRDAYAQGYRCGKESTTDEARGL